MNRYIYWGPQIEFKKKYNFTNKMYFSELVRMVQKEDKTFSIEGIKNETYNAVGKIENLIVESDEYLIVNEWVLYNFDTFITRFDIDNVYFQNPPLQVYDRIIKLDNCQEDSYDYKKIDSTIVKEIYKEFSNKIVGQEKVKEKLSDLLYASTFNFFDERPLVIMFYGPSGVGKTETAKFISDKMGGRLFRKQFSMFQNNEFANYLFGTKHNESSFAKDLLDRENNIILLDEFDKANNLFFSAFYQLFDEGLYEDKNYSVKLKNSIIICTSNYENLDDIKNNLGLPIYNRFDGFINFLSLNNEACVKIIDSSYEKYIRYLSEEQKELIVQKNIIEKIKVYSNKFNNAREIDRCVRDTIVHILGDFEIKEND